MQSLRFFVLAAVAAAALPAAALDLTILHTNDTHSFAAGVDARGRACLNDAKCVGGLARVSTAIRERKAQTDNVIALDAGDLWQGTLFFTANGWPMVTDLAQSIGWDAVTLGNHEFDKGCGETRKFVESFPVPVLAANLTHGTDCPLSRTEKLPPYIIKTVRGVPVGIIGLANDEVKHISRACPATDFSDRAAALQKVVDELEENGVKHIIALTHVGYPADQVLAHKVTGIDVIVGGHSHDLLGDGPGAVGPYPTVVRALDGNKTLIVTAKRSAQYLGELNVTFDESGHVTGFTGEDLLLTPEMPGDAEVRRKVRHYAQAVEVFKTTKVTVNNVRMADGLDPCREGECLSGLLTADAMLAFGRRYGADAAILNGGAVREAMPAGVVTHGDLLAIHPFADMIRMREVKGSDLLKALENGVSDPDVIGPYLLQPAGIRYHVESKNPLGHRTRDAEIFTGGRWQSINPGRTYRIVMNDYLFQGGDGFYMLTKGAAVECDDILEIEVFEQYLKRFPAIRKPATGRILWH